MFFEVQARNFVKLIVFQAPRVVFCFMMLSQVLQRISTYLDPRP